MTYLSLQALLVAAHHGHEVLMTHLLDHGADMYHRDRVRTPAFTMNYLTNHWFTIIIVSVLHSGTKKPGKI